MPQIPRPEKYPCVPVAAQVVNRPRLVETSVLFAGIYPGSICFPIIYRRIFPKKATWLQNIFSIPYYIAEKYFRPYYIWEHFRRFCLPAVGKYFRLPTIYRTYLFAFAQMLSKKIFLGESFRPDPSWLVFHSLRPDTHLTCAEIYLTSPITRLVFCDNKMVLPDSLAISPGMCWAMAYGLVRKSSCRKYRHGGLVVVWSPVKRKME